MMLLKAVVFMGAAVLMNRHASVVHLTHCLVSRFKVSCFQYGWLVYSVSRNLEGPVIIRLMID